MNRTSAVSRIWIGFAVATFSALVLGGLAALAAAHQAPVWAALAVALAGLAVLGTGGLVASFSGGGARALAAEAERLEGALGSGRLDVRLEAAAVPEELGEAVEHMNAVLTRLAGSLETTTAALFALAKGEVPSPLPDRPVAQLPGAKEAVAGAAAALSALLEDARALAAAGGTRAEVPLGRHAGRFLKAAQALEASRQQLAERCYWYEQILDAIPFPLSVTDKDMRWTFINAPVERFLGVKRKDVLGKACENWNADICRTENCGIARLRKGEPLTRFNQQGRNFRVDTVYLKNMKGENVGHVEVVQDVTALVRVGEYQREELSKLSRSLVQLAGGDLGIDTKVGQGDEHTQEAREQFLGTVKSLERLRGAVGALVRDTTRLVEAAATGQLSERADPRVHEGEFRKVVEGVNRTIDALIAPVKEATLVLERLAQRDLTARVTSSFPGDHSRAKEAVNGAAQALHHALSQVSEAVEQVSSAATQIAASSQAVASGASEQAASLEETSSSIEEVASMTKQSADNAQQANHLAETARAAAGAGTAAVEQMQAAMSRIKASAEGTSQIIRDINDIAFQTNLLALNAAVEAARAGEAGRGFAVVAEEVRSLALRAKEAAMKTEELIRQSVKEAGDGEVTAKQVAGKLTEIAGGISKVTDIISEIAAGAKEQSSGIDQVNRAVAEMDKVTQQNAASAEESSSAASQLSGQAEELASMIGAFRLERASRLGSLPAPAHLPSANGAAAPATPATKDADKLFPMDGPGGARDF